MLEEQAKQIKKETPNIKGKSKKRRNIYMEISSQIQSQENVGNKCQVIRNEDQAINIEKKRISKEDQVNSKAKQVIGNEDRVFNQEKKVSSNDDQMINNENPVISNDYREMTETTCNAENDENNISVIFCAHCQTQATEYYNTAYGEQLCSTCFCYHIENQMDTDFHNNETFINLNNF